MEASNFTMEEVRVNSTCEKHGDYERLDRKLMGRTFQGRCPECERIEHEEAVERHRQSEEKERQARLERKLNMSGIPQRFRGKLFSNFDADTDAKRKAMLAAKEFADTFDEHIGRGTTVIMSGSPGTGKSHLALAIAQQLVNRNTVFYVNALDAIRMVRDTWRRDSEKSESDVLDTLGGIDLLIIDEVGVQYGTEGEQVIMFDIINRRYRDMMPTILLTNLGKQGLKDYLGDRSFDRLREDGMWIAFDWESYRVRRAA
jgi:DNA replication protein DnaC